MKKNIFITILSIAVCVIAVSVILDYGDDTSLSTQPNTAQSQTYENGRFGYKAVIPASFSTQESSQNNDGRVFADDVSSTTIRVYGRHNINQQDLSALVADYTRQLESVRDTQVGSSSAVIIGEQDTSEKIIKILHRPDTVAVLELTGSESGLAESQQEQVLQGFRWSQQQQSEEQPTSTEDARPVSYTPQSAEDMIQVTKPTSKATISSPLEISGQARGQWFFEADAPVVLTDWDGRIIAEGYIQAEGEWMTEDFVDFSGTLEFNTPEDTGPQSVRGNLIIQRANPSGQPENDMAVDIPVRFRR